MIEKQKPLKKRKRIKLSQMKMPSLLVFCLGGLVGFFICLSYTSIHIAPPSLNSHHSENPSLKVCFSPEEKCTPHIVSTLEHAKSSIWVMAYTLTCPDISQALLRAFERGVDVKILIDKSQLSAPSSQLSFFVQNGVPLFIDSTVGIALNKVMIIDEVLVLTGSYNWSRAANTRNAENLLFIRDPSLAELYKQNWEKRLRKASPPKIP